jgi:hypothetical protein
MKKARFDIGWIGYCEPTDKVWGWFFDLATDGKPYKYVFFAHIKHTITLKKFPRYSSELDNIVKKKISNKYGVITFKELVEIWPDFMTELENKFTFDKLAEKI